MMDSRLKKMALFLLLSVLIVSQRRLDWVLALDNWVYLQAINLSYSKIWLQFWHAWTLIGDGTVVYPVLVSMVFFLLRYRFSWANILYTCTLVCLSLSTIVLKNIFQIERPVGFTAFYAEPVTYTFPSGHAFTAVLLCYLVPRLMVKISHKSEQARLQKSVWLSPWFYLLGIILISFSRVFLGVHWFSDIVAGVVWGGCVSFLGLWLFEKV